MNETKDNLQVMGSLAKLTPPRLSNVYARASLYAALDRALERPIVWITGAPGAGKTTFVGAYLSAHKQRTLWYQLDEGDSDPATFFHYLSIAAKNCAPRSRTILPVFSPIHLPSLGAFARQYFERLGLMFRQSIMLVLDNYHEVATDSPLHTLLAEAIPLLPAHVRVIVISRIETPAAYARLQINRHIAPLGAEIFKLSPQEIAGLAEKLGYRLDAERIAYLHAHTGGWTAGLLLLLEHSAYMSMATSTETAMQVLFDYFAGEILHRMPQSLQRALQQLAFLPAMTTSLARELTLNDETATLLEQFARRHYFTQRHAGIETNYQFHPLFKAFLQAQARANLSVQELVALQQSAARLLQQRGMIEDAVELLRSAGDWAELSYVVIVNAPIFAQQGRLQTTLAWIAAIPEVIQQQSPWLLYWRAQCRMMFNPEEARDYSEKAFALFDQANDAAGLYLSWASIVYTFAIGWQNMRPLDHWIERFATIEERFPEIPSAEITAHVTVSMLVVLTHRQPRYPNVERWTRLAATIISSPGNLEYRIMLAAYLGLFYIWSGPFAGAAELESQISPLVTGDVSPTTQILWRCFVGMHASSRTSHTACLVAAEQGRQIADDSGVHVMDGVIGIIGVHACLAAGSVSAAECWVEKTNAPRNSGQIDYTIYYNGLSLLAMHKREFQLSANYAQKALAAAQEYGNLLPEGVGHVGLAQALFEMGDSVQARQQLAMGWEVSARSRSDLVQYLCWFGQASDAICFGGDTDWVEPLQALLAREKLHGGMGVPLWPMSRVTQIYMFALEQGIEVEYVRSVIRRRKLMPDSPPLHIEHWPFPVTIHTLGHFTLQVDDTTPDLSGKGSAKPLELIKCLIALGGRDVAQEKIIAALWPDAEGDAGRVVFNTTLYRLRKLIAHDAAVILKDGVLSLDPHRVWLDVWAVERAMEQLNNALNHAKPATVIAPLEQRIFKYYSGPFLAQDKDKNWLLAQRETVHSRMLQCVLRLARYWGEQGRIDAAIVTCERALSIDRLHEPTYQHLMQALLQHGRHAEVVATYERCRKLLSTALGVMPSAQTVAVYRMAERLPPA